MGINRHHSAVGRTTQQAGSTQIIRTKLSQTRVSAFSSAGNSHNSFSLKTEEELLIGGVVLVMTWILGW